MDTGVVQIKDLCLKITDGSHFSPADIVDGEYCMFSVKDMMYNSFNYETCKHIDYEMFKKLSKADCRPLKNDILIAKDGSYLKFVFKVKEDLDACILSSIAILRPNLEVINPDYFVYVLRTKSIHDAMANYVSGSALPRIILSDFKKMKIKLILDKDTQLKVANVLSKYDELIENNDKRIKLLEKMGESLYKEWFIRFRFPGYEKITFKDSELGKIPSSFNIVKICEVLEYYVGGGWGNDNFSSEYSVPAYVIRGADFPLVNNSNVSSCPYRFHKPSNFSSRKLKENDIVFEISGGTAEQPVGRGILVTKGILNQLNDNVICASFCKLIRPNYNEVKPNYFYQWLKFLYNTRMINRFQLQSTGIINFKFEYFLRKGIVLIPPMGLMEKYEETVKTMRDEIDKLAIENTLLKKQRDSLLPRLMSGKIKLEGKEVI